MRSEAIVVVGGGPAGSVCAARLAQLGRRVVLFECEAFPRFRLGESLLPGSMDVFDRLGVMDALRARFIEKRGAQFHDDALGKTSRFAFSEAHQNRFDAAFQVPRDEFDALLLAHAASLGVDVRHGARVTSIDRDGGEMSVTIRTPDAAEQRVPAAFVIDATGRAALMAHKHRTIERIPSLANVALYTHVRGAARDAGERAGDIHIVCSPGASWFWFIPFADGRTSVGAVVPSSWMRERARRDVDVLFREAIAESPNASRLFQGAEVLWPARAAADFSYRVRDLAGDGWVAVGDAGGFIDPLFSTGVHMATIGADLAAVAVDRALSCGDTSRAAFADFERTLRVGTETFMTAVRAFYAGKLQPYLFAEVQRTTLRRSITSLLSGDVFNGSTLIPQPLFPIREKGELSVCSDE